MGCIDFWSKKYGNDKRRAVINLKATEEEKAQLRGMSTKLPEAPDLKKVQAASTKRIELD